jgi:hypothetical protein
MGVCVHTERGPKIERLKSGCLADPSHDGQNGLINIRRNFVHPRRKANLGVEVFLRRLYGPITPLK